MPQEPVPVLCIAPCPRCPEQGNGLGRELDRSLTSRGIFPEQGARERSLYVQQGCFYLRPPPSSPTAKRICGDGVKARTGFCFVWVFFCFSLPVFSFRERLDVRNHRSRTLSLRTDIRIKALPEFLKNAIKPQRSLEKC